MLDLIAHVLLALLTLAAWFGIGSLLLARLPVADPILDLLNRVGAGAVATALLTFGAGWMGIVLPGLYRAFVAGAATAGVVAAARGARRLSRPQPRTWRPWELALGCLIALYVALGVVATAAPVTSPDALLYHSADPALFERLGEILEIPWNSSSYEPFTVEMLVLGGTLLWDPTQGAFAPFLLGLLALAAVTGAAFRLGGRALALLAGAIFYAQPFMAWEVTSVFVEPGLAATVALASWNLARFVQDDERNALVLGGAFVGAAAGTKYLGLIAGAALALALAILVWRRLTLRIALAFVVSALVVAAPWYVKNAVLTGNPFYPHLLGGLNDPAAAELERSMRSFGHGREPWDAALLPVRLLTGGDAYDGGEFVSPLFLAFAPLVLLLPRSRRPPTAVWLAVLLFVVAWFVTTQQARFLVPVMPALAILAAMGAFALASRGRTGRAVSAAAAVVGFSFGLVASTVYVAQFAPVVAGVQARDDFLVRKVSLYEGVVWLNENLDDADRVVVDNWSLLYLRVPYTTFGTMGDLLPPEAGAPETRSFLRSNEVTHAAVLETNAQRVRQMESVGGQLVARVPVRSVRSRTRSELGPRRTMLVFRLPTTEEA